MVAQLLGGKKRSVSHVLAMAAVAVGAVVLPQRSANAALKLVLDGGTTNATTINDNGAGDSANTVTGTIVNTGINFGGLAVTVNTATSNSPGTAASGILSIQTLTITNNNSVPVTLTVQASDTGFTQPGTPLSLLNITSSLSGTSSGAGPGDVVTFQSFFDPTNGQSTTGVGGTGSPTALQSLPITASFNNTTSETSALGTGAYSLTNYLTISISGGATANFTGITTATPGTSVPEPTLGIVPALALGLLARRRRSR
jgi:MYXO-CTERM domain-containing protein